MSNPIAVPNATLTFTTRGAMTGRDPVTRQPIYANNVFTLRARVVNDRQPAIAIFPGADELSDLFKGRFTTPPHQDFLPGQTCTVQIDGGVAMTAQIKFLAINTAETAGYAGRTQKGQMFYLLTTRGGG